MRGHVTCGLWRALDIKWDMICDERQDFFFFFFDKERQDFDLLLTAFYNFGSHYKLQPVLFSIVKPRSH